MAWRARHGHQFQNGSGACVCGMETKNSGEGGWAGLVMCGRVGDGQVVKEFGWSERLAKRHAGREECREGQRVAEMGKWT